MSRTSWPPNTVGQQDYSAEYGVDEFPSSNGQSSYDRPLDGFAPPEEPEIFPNDELNDVSDGPNRMIGSHDPLRRRQQQQQPSLHSYNTSHELYQIQRARKKRQRQRIMKVIGVIVVIMLVAMMLGLSFGLSNRRDKQTNNESPDPIPAPVPAPIDVGQNIFDRQTPEPVVMDYDDDDCIDAVTVEWSTLGNNNETSNSHVATVQINGTTDVAAFDMNGLQACGSVHFNGAGTWFILTNMGDESTRILASTCENTWLDTQISIYTSRASSSNSNDDNDNSNGTCSTDTIQNGVNTTNLQCVGGNDQSPTSSGGCGNGDQSHVVWLAERETTYYILVHGFGVAMGDFVLQLSPLPSMVDDRCETSTLQVSVNRQDENDKLITFGSTIGASLDNTNLASAAAIAECGSATGPGVWYKVQTGFMEDMNATLGNTLHARLFTYYAGFTDAELIVLMAPTNTTPSATSDVVAIGCEALQCVGSSIMKDGVIIVSWPETARDVEYYIFVRGPTRNSRGGDFALQVTRTNGTQPLPPPIPPMNDKCPNASTLPVPTQHQRGETTYATLMDNATVVSCGSQVFQTAPGVWYTIDLPLQAGVRWAMTVKVCADPLTLVSTKVSVYQGTSSCEELICVDGNEVLPAQTAWTTNSSMSSSAPSFCQKHSQQPASVTWVVEDSQQYFILVHGYGSHVGSYDISLEPAAVSNGGTDCPSALEIQLPHDLDNSIVGEFKGNAVQLDVPMCSAHSSIEPPCDVCISDDQCSPGWCTAGNCGDRYGKVDLGCSCKQTKNCKPPLKCKWGVCRHRDDPAKLFSQSGLCAPCSTNADCPSETCLAGNCADASHGKVTSGCSCEKTSDCLPPLKCNGNVCNTELPGTRSLNDEVHQLIEANEAGWYKLVGLGQQLVASPCHHSTTFSAHISVFTSPSANCSVSDLCATNAEYYSCRDDRMAVSWYAEVDQVYYILVYAGDADQQQPQPSGERYFALSLHQAAINDSCNTAIGPVSISPTLNPSSVDPLGARSTTFGATTLGSTNLNLSDLCPLALDDGGASPSSTGQDYPLGISRGLWYSVEGTGTNLTATTCSEFTNFESRVAVFLWQGKSDTTGSKSAFAERMDDALEDCDNFETFASSFECVGYSPTKISTANTTVICPPTSTITWDSKSGSVYLILVQGRTELDDGNFGLRITEID